MHTYVHVYGHTHSHTPHITAARNVRTHVFCFCFFQFVAPPPRRTRLSVCPRQCTTCALSTHISVLCLDPALAAPKKWSTNLQEFTCQVFGPLCSGTCTLTYTHAHTHSQTHKHHTYSYMGLHTFQSV